MKIFKKYSNMALFSALFMMTFIMGGCGGSSSCEDIDRPTIAVGAPIITSTIPPDGATNVPIDQNISATFSEVINPSTVNTGTFTVVDANGEPVPGTVGYSDNDTIMIFTPDNILDYNSTYTATITTDVTDMDGNALDVTNNLNVWSFTTISEADVFPPTANTAPIVVSTIPVDGAINVPRDRNISALLSKTLDTATVNETTFILHNDTNDTNVSGTVSYNDDRMVYFDPDVNLHPNTNYTATITTDVTDQDGNNLDDSNGLNIWSFTTIAEGTTPAKGPNPINLGRAGDFAILTKAGITNIFASDITGNIGSSPITAAAMNDVTCPEMAPGFFIHGVDAAYTGSSTCFVAYSVLVSPAVFDMEAAYTDAATRTPATGANLNIGGGSLEGQTFTPGLYTWGTNVTITNSITLEGNANDTWIFQISGNLSLAPNAQIILGPDVNTKNIFWQVAGSNTTINTAAQFKGIILGLNLIAVKTGASVDGRLLSQKAVTLEMNRITQPAE